MFSIQRRFFLMFLACFWLHSGCTSYEAVRLRTDTAASDNEIWYLKRWRGFLGLGTEDFLRCYETKGPDTYCVVLSLKEVSSTPCLLIQCGDQKTPAEVTLPESKKPSPQVTDSPEVLDLQSRCDTGDLSACNSLGEMLLASGPTRDPKRSARVLLKACYGNVMSACTSLGYLHGKGDGVPPDAGRAVELFKKACAGGDAPGCSFLGNMLETGSGISRNMDAALEVYRKACDGGYAEACDRVRALSR